VEHGARQPALCVFHAEKLAESATRAIAHMRSIKQRSLRPEFDCAQQIPGHLAHSRFHQAWEMVSGEDLS
jgi:hypothetical protein